MSGDATAAVLRLLEQVPAGKVVTYGDLGAAAGTGARRVGQVVARGGHDLAWWRVVDAGGHPPEAAQDAAAERYEAEATPFRRTGGRVVVALREARWELP